jgi:hypothetical protein
MNKLQRLKKTLIREGSILGAVILALVVLLLVANYLQQGALARKTDAENLLNQDRAQLALMQSQLSKAGEALQRFDALRLRTEDQNFANNTEALKTLLRRLKTQFRLSNTLRLTITGAQASQQADLQALNYKVLVREDMELKIAAMSDVHVYSFLDEWLREAPGIIRLTGFELSRRAPMSLESLAQMKNGAAPDLVDGTIRFTWITLESKNAPTPPVPSATPVQSTGGE